MNTKKFNPLFNFYNFRRNLRTLTILVLIFFCVSTFGNVYASELHEKLKYRDAATVINYYSNSDTIFTIDDSRQLKSFSTDEDQYTLYSLKPYGYAILFNDNNSLMEACYQEGDTSPITFSDSLTYYYAGPMSYFLRDGDNFVDITNKHILTEDDISVIQAAEGRVVALERANAVTSADLRSSTVNYNVNQSYFQNLLNFGNNANGTCTVIAISILLRYYDYFINDNYVSTIYQNGTGTTEGFHQHLNSFIFDPGETAHALKIRDVGPNINEYLGTRGVNTFFDSDFAAFSNTNRIVDAIISILAANKPVVASMSTYHGGTWDHTVVVYGVTYNSSDKYGTAAYHIHTGWPGSPEFPRLATVSASWFYEYGSLECAYANHQYTNYAQYTHSHHLVMCDCAAQYTQAHSFIQTALGNKCTKCYYIDNSSAIMAELNETQ